MAKYYVEPDKIVVKKGDSEGVNDDDDDLFEDGFQPAEEELPEEMNVNDNELDHPVTIVID